MLSQATECKPVEDDQNGTTVIGDLTYEYDKAGNRTNGGPGSGLSIG